MKTLRFNTACMAAVALLATVIGFIPPAYASGLPEGYEEMIFDKDITITAIGELKLYYSVPENGTLTVTQTGDNDSHLFASEPTFDSELYYNLNTPIPSRMEQGVMTYGLDKGEICYYVARLNPADNLSEVRFEWKAADQNDNILELNRPYQFNNQTPVYSLTAPASGILTAQWSALNSGDTAFDTSIANDNTQYFLYTNAACTRSAIPVFVGEGQNGWLVKFQVEAGQVYYVKLGSLDSYQCIFSLDEGAVAVASISGIEPLPGSAYSTKDYRNYWNIQLQPNNPTVERIDLSYVSAETEDTITITLENPVVDQFAMRVPAASTVALIEDNAILYGSYFTYTLYGLKANGSYVTENDMTVGRDFVNIGENGKVEISFMVSDPIKAKSASLPQQLYQISNPADSTLCAQISYSGNIGSVGEINIIEGSIVQGGQTNGDNAPASVTVPADNVAFDGTILYIRFGGIDLSSLKPGSVTVWVGGVKGENGLLADYDGFSAGTYYLNLVAGTQPGYNPEEQPEDDPGNIDGIERVEANSHGSFNVYNINGTFFVALRSSDDIRRLPKGIYIINGKKIKV